MNFSDYPGIDEAIEATTNASFAGEFVNDIVTSVGLLRELERGIEVFLL
jgi:hypothetical protein